MQPLLARSLVPDPASKARELYTRWLSGPGLHVVRQALEVEHIAVAAPLLRPLSLAPASPASASRCAPHIPRRVVASHWACNNGCFLYHGTFVQ